MGGSFSDIDDKYSVFARDRQNIEVFSDVDIDENGVDPEDINLQNSTQHLYHPNPLINGQKRRHFHTTSRLGCLNFQR